MVSEAVLTRLLTEQKTEFIDALDNQQKEFKTIVQDLLITVGIDMEKSEEMQDLMSMLREMKRERATVKYKIIDKFTSSILAILIALLVSGLTYLYVQKQTAPVVNRNEKMKISEIYKRDGGGGGGGP